MSKASPNNGRYKVVLYNPAAVFFTMPLALVAIGSMLDRKRFDVRIVDARLHRDPMKVLRRELDHALCLGVTVLTGAPLQDALNASRVAKAQNPDLPVIWGGWHPSLFPTETLAEPAVDYTVQGQGEIAFRDLVEQLAGGRVASDLPGVAQRAEGVARAGAPRAMAEMDELTPHNYELIDVEGYFRLKGRRQIDYISSTGCFFRCAFCADPFVYKRSWTAISPERMGTELEDLWKRYRFDDLNFQDETFFTYTDRVTAIANEILQRGLRFSWAATMRADQGWRMSDEDWKLCVRSGLRRVLIGVESGDEDMVKWMQKDISLEQVIHCAEQCVRHDVGAIFPFIVGFPGETDASVRKTMAMMKRLRQMSPKFDTPMFYFKPYPGSAITREVVEQGYSLPQTLEQWAEFDYIGSSGPWVSDEKYRYMERFKFYNRMSGGRRTPVRLLPQTVARFRCDRDLYGFPLEKVVYDSLGIGEQLS